MGNVASRFKWVFGNASAEVGANNVANSTGAGTAFNTQGWGENFTFQIETDAAATCAYQIRSARKAAGPWSVLSSGTLSTGALDVVQLPGPLGFVSPRLKTLNSTANMVVVQMSAVEA